MLYICEKPSQGKDIAAVLGASESYDGYMTGNGITVTWCLGHLLTQAAPEHYCSNLKPWRRSVLPIVPHTWVMQPNPKRQQQFAIVTRLINAATHIVIATDADREGEAIARELLHYCHYRGKVERLWLSALDKVSIKKALGELKSGASTERLYYAALGRSRADWLVGMNMTMAVTATFSHGQGVLSVGRVQTPTLQLVVNRDNAIKQFIPSDYYVVTAQFTAEDKRSVMTRWQIPDDIQDKNGHCADKALAEKVCAAIEGKIATITDFRDEQKETTAPLCLSLSHLQKLASQQLGLGAKKTLDIAQALYETHKVITYPRTDCGYLPMSQHQEAHNILATVAHIIPELQPIIERADYSYQSPVFNDAKITAHHGIIPTTNKSVTVNQMTTQQQAVYSIIARYYLAQFLGPYVFSRRSITVACNNHRFIANENTPLILGWKPALTTMTHEDLLKKKELPDFANGNRPSLLCVASGVDAKVTSPPVHFTEGTLIMAMKNVAREVEDKALKKILTAHAGIGTEATRANIIELLLRREFLRKEKQQLIATEKGRTLLDKLPHVLKHPATTARWEQMLNDIATGDIQLGEFLDNQATALSTMLERFDKIVMTQPRGDSTALHQCPDCKSALRRFKGKKGFFWGCTAYPTCTTTLLDSSGKPVMRKPEIHSRFDCPTCQQHKLVKRQGKKKTQFWGCAGYPECRAIFWDTGNRPDFYNVPSPQGVS